MKSFLSALVLLVFVTSSSAQIGGSKISFTTNKLMEYEFNDVDLTRVQFYISSMVSLKREFTKEDRENANQRGKVVFESGKAYEYFEIKNGSFCVFESLSEDKSQMGMRFGQGPGEVLPFVLKAGRGIDTEQYFVLDVGEDKILQYGGLGWDLISYLEVRLMVKEVRKGSVNAAKQKTKGMKIDGTDKKRRKKNN